MPTAGDVEEGSACTTAVKEPHCMTRSQATSGSVNTRAAFSTAPAGVVAGTYVSEDQAFFVPSTVAAELCALAVLAVKEADKTKPSGQTKINLFFMFEFLLLK